MGISYTSSNTSNEKFDISDVEFVSSHWSETTQKGLTYEVNARESQIWEEEYFNASFSVKNNGWLARSSNATIAFTYNGQTINRFLSMGDLPQGSDKAFIVPFLPGSSDAIMDWSNAEATFDITAKGMGVSLVTGIKVPILVDTSNFKANVPAPIDHNSPQEDIQGLGLSTHVVDVIDVYEYSTSGSRGISKGSGPNPKVTIKFNSNVNGFYIDYTLKSLTHGWTDTYTHYWSGSYSSGSTVDFSIGFGWNFANSKYVFGQGTYEVYSATARGSGFTDTGYSGTDGEFSVSQVSFENRVFLLAVYDNYVTSNHNCLDRSASSYITDATNEFDNHASFDIDYYITMKNRNWLGAHGGLARTGISLCGGIGTVYVADETNSQLQAAARDAAEYVLGITTWESSYVTRNGNNGFDQMHAFTGLLRSHDSDHNSVIGQAYNRGNRGFSTAGLESAFLGVPIGWWTVGDDRYDNLIQHELSHNWGANHEDGNNVMSPTICNCNNWFSTAANTIGNNQEQFNNVPTS